MKNSKFINLLLIVATSLLLVNCTTDPIPGPAGEDGIDGIDGVDGITGTTECASCHNISTSEAVHASYLYSGHAAGGAVGYAGKRGSDKGSCTQCHSNEGYIDYVETGTVQLSVAYENATPISCTGCHNKHSSFDFENDGFDAALRLIDPVTLITDASVIIDFPDRSNNCVLCHQPRRTGPEDNGLGLYEVTSTHWGPHHGPQSTLLEGIQGIEITGGLDYPDKGTAGHRTGTSCTKCHMGETEPNAAKGLHTFKPTRTDCATCHQNGIPDKVDGLAENMATLLAILEAEGILESKINDGHLSVHPVVGTFPILTAEAAWNYLFLYEDASNGIHNPKYAKALIQNSLDALSAD
ncbi:hypothetical protein [Lutimonas vermicola]|uniref:Cytochrome c domain-containing protein n=1 Tax=Lutimonas vermicola TaxID=414288 RepID=A0ABU9KY48_9FLAO